MFGNLDEVLRWVLFIYLVIIFKGLGGKGDFNNKNDNV